MSRPDQGIVGCEQLAAALGGVTDSDVKATGELNPAPRSEPGGGDVAADLETLAET